MKQILITGASGFIGGHLVEAALDRGLDVYAGVRKTSSLEYLKDSRIHIVYLNFDDKAVLAETLKEYKFDYIIHNAGTTKARKKEMYDYVNFTLTKNFIDTLIATDTVPEKFLLVSSLAAKGPGDEKSLLPVDNDSPPNPLTRYGKSKLKAEEYLASLGSFPYVIVRPTAVYGPREKEILSFFKIVNSGFELLIGFKEQHLTFIYVKDLVEIIMRAVSDSRSGNAYFAASEKSYSTKALATIVKTILEKKTFSLHVPVTILKIVAFVSEKIEGFSGHYPSFNLEKVNELQSINWKCDINLVKMNLNYTPQTSLEDGLKTTLGWYKKHKWL